MRPPGDDRGVSILRQHVPEFENYYLDLIDIYDEDLTPQVVFNELADFVIEMVQLGDRDETVGRCFSALELIALDPSLDGTELIAYCFLDQLPPFVLDRVRGYLEPVTETIFDEVDQDYLYDDDGETALLLSDRRTPGRKSVPAEGD